MEITRKLLSLSSQNIVTFIFSWKPHLNLKWWPNHEVVFIQFIFTVKTDINNEPEWYFVRIFLNIFFRDF